jgi:hypothetical protein
LVRARRRERVFLVRRSSGRRAWVDRDNRQQPEQTWCQT